MRGNILVVDDEPMVLESVRLTLAHFGYHVETADSGPDALRKLERATFDLVVTDRKMAGMSGEELAQRIKRQWSALPVLLLTGYPPDRSPDAVDLVLLKPFSTAELRNSIDALILGRQNAQTGPAGPGQPNAPL